VTPSNCVIQNVCFWHKADVTTVPIHWGKADMGRRSLNVCPPPWTAEVKRRIAANIAELPELLQKP